MSTLSLVIRILMTVILGAGMFSTVINMGGGKLKAETGCLSLVLNLLLVAGVWLI